MSDEQNPNEQEDKVWITRHPGDYRKVEIPLRKIWGIHVSSVSGGINRVSAHPGLWGYISCADLNGQDFGHSCRHGPPPHDIKVYILKGWNREIYSKIEARVKPR